MSMRKEKAGGGNPPATTVRRPTSYHRRAIGSRVNLSQAADVLCLLAFWPLTITARVGFTALFERQLHRAYEGVSR